MEEQTNNLKATRKAKQTKRFYVLVTGAVVVILAVAIFKFAFPDSEKPNTPPVAIVRITKDGFSPATLSVKQGTKVTWTNTDNALHQVASNPYPKNTDLPSLKSEILNNEQTYTYTADKVGTYGYHDQLRPTVNGTLVVQKQ